ASGETGPPTKITGGSAARRRQPGKGSDTSIPVGRLSTTPTAPSSPCSSTSTTVRSKFGSPMAGLATSRRPLSGGVTVDRPPGREVACEPVPEGMIGRVGGEAAGDGVPVPVVAHGRVVAVGPHPVLRQHQAQRRLDGGPDGEQVVAGHHRFGPGNGGRLGGP